MTNNIAICVKGEKSNVEFPLGALNGHTLVEGHLDVDFNYTIDVLKIVLDIYKKTIILPCVQVRGFEDLYNAIRITKYLEYPDDLYNECFITFTDHKDWGCLAKREYIYPVYKLLPICVDFEKMFRDFGTPYTCLIRSLLEVPLYRDVANRIDLIKFYTELRLTQMFNKGDATIRAKLDELYKYKKAYYPHLLMNPHTKASMEYLVCGDSSANKWQCAKITSVEQLKNGALTICSKEDFRTRFHAFTCNVFKVSPNPELAGKRFPWKNVCVAGGAIEQILTPNYMPKKTSDVDIWIYGNTFAEKKETFEAVFRWFMSPATYYVTKSAVVCVYLMDVQRKFQIINSNYTDCYGVISHFDMSHLQFLVKDLNECEEFAIKLEGFKKNPISVRDLYECPSNDMGAENLCVLGMYSSFEAFSTRMSRVCNIQRLKIDRIIKCMYRGFDVEKNPLVIEKFGDLDEFTHNPDHKVVREVLRDLQKYYFPSREQAVREGQNEADMHEYVLAMISMDSNVSASMATRDVKTVIANVILDSNFNSGYDMLDYKKFNPITIHHQSATRPNLGDVIVKTKFGKLRLMSCDCTVTRISEVDDGDILMNLKPMEKDFIQLMTVFETNVFRMYTVGAVTKNVIDAEGTLTTRIQKFKLDNQNKFKYSIAKNNKGLGINVKEDIRSGDIIHFLFHVMISAMTNGDKFVSLIPYKYIKHCTDEEIKEYLSVTDLNTVTSADKGEDDSEDEANEVTSVRVSKRKDKGKSKGKGKGKDEIDEDGEDQDDEDQDNDQYEDVNYE